MVAGPQILNLDTACLLVFVYADGLRYSDACDLRAVVVDVHLVLDMLDFVGAIDVFLDDRDHLHMSIQSN